MPYQLIYTDTVGTHYKISISLNRRMYLYDLSRYFKINDDVAIYIDTEHKKIALKPIEEETDYSFKIKRSGTDRVTSIGIERIVWDFGLMPGGYSGYWDKKRRWLEIAYL